MENSRTGTIWHRERLESTKGSTKSFSCKSTVFHILLQWILNNKQLLFMIRIYMYRWSWLAATTTTKCTTRAVIVDTLQFSAYEWQKYHRHHQQILLLLMHKLHQKSSQHSGLYCLCLVSGMDDDDVNIYYLRLFTFILSRCINVMSIICEHGCSYDVEPVPKTSSIKWWINSREGT